MADVEEVDGVPLIHVRANAEGQRLKTSAAERRIPVHPELVRLGFLDFVNAQRKAGHERLFPELPAGALGNYSDPFSKWFARFLTKAGVTSAGAVFHSFRHTWRTGLRDAGVQDGMADILGGWVSPGQGRRFGDGGEAQTLADNLYRLAYRGLDLTPLYNDPKAV